MYRIYRAMSNGIPNRVLIGYSNNFASRSYFIRKVTRLLSGMHDFGVVSLNDKHGFIATVLGDRITEQFESAAIHPREIRKIVNGISHMLIFWDGQDLNEFIYAAALLKKPNRIIPVETAKVVNKDDGQYFDVYIGRGTPWGNPFVIGREGDRFEVIEKFRKHFESQILADPSKHRALLSLKGKRLGCHCKPAPCHGDVIAEYLNSMDVPESGQEDTNIRDVQASLLK